ncbi:MAG: hypothetical protein IPF92_16290 [Myxococcales bacterium]|nr:hypothetical protein [Myxococcales bacterium]MBL0195366.1 hypothetical protein [Myxococcales bacterium]
MGSHESLALLFAGAGSAALGWGGVALAGAADLRALLWLVAGALALRVALRFSGSRA